MASSYLPDDCIYDILTHLRNHRSTLFNCLLVNRFWSEATVPLLYANPFVDINAKSSSTILTLIRCFNKTEILQLKNQLKIINLDNININDEYKPLFEYPKYLKIYDCFKINTTIVQWIDTPLKSLLSKRQIDKIYSDFAPTFHQSILRQCDNIKQLNISLYLFYNISYNIQAFTSILTKLNSLNLHDVCDIAQEFLSNIVNNSLNLRKLEILIRHIDTSTKEKLCAIIQNQKSLEVFKISHCDKYLLDDVLSSLEFQKHSLAYIEFESINLFNVSFKNFINLCNLKCLIFCDCKSMLTSESLNQHKILKYASFNLKELTFRHNNWDDNITPSIIEYFGSSLKKLTLIESLEIPIIRNISSYCSNLIILQIEINRYINLLVFPYFKDLKIRVLNLSADAGGRNECSSMSEIFKNLAINLPVNVKEVSIRFRNPYSPYNFQHFKKFLESCHNEFEIINLNHYFINSRFLKMILNYVKRSGNSLKCLGIVRQKRIITNDGESKLLESKGVKIEDFF